MGTPTAPAPPVGRAQRALIGVLAYRPDVDGRILVGVVVAVYFVTISVFRAVWGINIWPGLGVPAAPSLFFDTRVVTAGLECRRLGMDPLVNNPCDPLGRPFNYPRVWLLLRYLGLGQSHTDVLAIVFIAAFLGALFFLFGRISLGEGAIVAAALCSPSVMFGVERANMDIVIFAFLVIAVVLWRRESALGEVASPVVVLLAALLKVFPAFGLLAYPLVRRRRATVAALLCMGVFAIYAIVTRSDIASIAHGTPQGQENAYGVRILPVAIYHRFVPERWQGGAVIKQLLAAVPVLICLPVVWRIGRRRLPRLDAGAGNWRRLAFHLGALIFLGTFAAFNNFDYRLVFLLLMLPQLIEWTTSPSDPRGPLAATTTVGLLVLLWMGALSAQLDLWDEVATWVTIVLVLTLLCACIPYARKAAVEESRGGPRDSARAG